MSPEHASIGRVEPDPDAPAAPASPEPAPRSRLGRKVASGALTEIGGYGLTQVLRFAANLLLTRLLFPEAFGLMAMLGVILYGLTMLSDVGVAQAIIRSPRGDDPRFLNTAWTILIMRGLGLWVLASLLAWPMSRFFQQPDLAWIIPLGAFATVTGSLGSTRAFQLRRQLRPGPLVLMELGAQLVGLAATLSGAYLGYGVLALVIGGLCGSVAHTLISHMLPGTHRDRFASDPDARKEILTFGRWIFASSAMTFVANRGDQFVLGRLLGAAGLGLYNVAYALADVPEAVAHRVIGGVLFPAFARGHQEHPKEMPQVYYRLRLSYDALLHTALGGLAGLAPWIIALLYDDRYLGATAMLQVLALRTAFGLMAQPCESYLVSLGLSHYGFRRQTCVAVTVFIAMPIGHWLAGTMGVLWASALARVAALAAIWPAAHAHGILRLRRELLVPLFLAVGFGLGTVIRWMLPSV